MGRLLMRADGRVFARSVIGFESEAEALQESKRLWKQDHAVKVARVGDRWQVWRSVR